MSTGIRYRPEIDGLRGVAVLPVLLFHAGFSWFRGGFVGVDVFFVISGYLITSILLGELAEGRFSIGRFYERRARRILPALLTVLIACIPLSWWLLPPSAMREFGKSMVAVAGFASNIEFWRESGYFDTSAEFKPLLHTWSLGVEEQYYVLFPLMLLLLWRLSRQHIITAIAAVVAGSLAIAEWLLVGQPDAAFFLLPTRAWELGIGSLLAVHAADHQRPQPSRKVAEAAAGIGLILVVGSVFYFDESTPFPGVHALVPTVGAALLIWATSRLTFAGSLLASKPAVALGLVSYSTYLWHQPLFAITRQVTINQPSLLVFGGLILLSILLAYLSWRYIEAPFRDRARTSTRTLIIVGLSGSVLVAGFGFLGWRSDGLPQRLGADKAQFASYFQDGIPERKYFYSHHLDREYRLDCDFYDIPAFERGHGTKEPRPAISPSCYTRDPGKAHAVLIWGDSHAQQLRAGLERELPADWQILQVASSGCEPQVAHIDGRPYCRHSNEFAMRAIASAKPDVVLLAQNDHNNPDAIIKDANLIREAGTPKVVVMGPVPHWVRDLPEIIIQRLWVNTPRFTGIGLDERRFAEDADLARAAQRGSIAFASAMSYFCPAQRKCAVFLGNDRREGITTYDYGHLTPVASTALARDVLVPLISDSAELH